MTDFNAIGKRLGLGSALRIDGLAVSESVLTKVQFEAGTYVVKVQDTGKPVERTLAKMSDPERLERLAATNGVPMAVPVVDPATNNINFVHEAEVVSVRQFLEGTPLHNLVPYQSRVVVEGLGRTIGVLEATSRELPGQLHESLTQIATRDIEAMIHERKAYTPADLHLLEDAVVIQDLQKEVVGKAAKRQWHLSNSDVDTNCMVSGSAVRIFDWDLSHPVMLEDIAVGNARKIGDEESLQAAYWKQYKAAGGNIESVLEHLPLYQQVSLVLIAGTMSSHGGQEVKDVKRLIDHIMDSFDEPSVLFDQSLLAIQSALTQALQGGRPYVGL